MKNKRMKNGKSNGITLVALVVTIVVLLILAGITINALLGKNSIFDLARKAGEETNQAVENEQSAMGNLINYIDQQGWNNGSSGSGSEKNPNLGEEKPLASTVQIGDYVAYNATEGVTDSSKLTYTSLKGTGMSHGNGYKSQTFTAKSDIKWRVFSKNEETGEIVLISDEAIKVDDGEKFYLYGAIGFLYGEQELHEIAKIYGYGMGANTSKTFTYEIGDPAEGVIEKSISGSGARSIIADDLNEISGYDPTTYQVEDERYGETFMTSSYDRVPTIFDESR